MRLILIIAGVFAILWFVGEKALDSFRLKGAKEASARVLTVPATKPTTPGGSLPASIQHSLTPVEAKEPEEIQSFRFTDRMPPNLPNLGNSVAVVVDPDSRTVLLKGPKRDVSLAMLALKDLDLSADACEVRTWAVYVDRTLGNGWDLTAALKSVSGADLGFSVGGGTASLSLSGNDVAAALDVIAENSAVDVLQRPHLTLLHGQVAEVEAADEVPLPQVSVSGNGFSQSGIVYRKVGLKLRVTPQFLGRDRVRLAVEQENGLIGSNVEVSPGLSAPIISTQRVFSSCELAIGETLVLGGVATERIVNKSGFLHDTTERQRGFLFVILSTASIAPRALTPEEAKKQFWSPQSPFPDVPGTRQMPGAKSAYDPLTGLGDSLPGVLPPLPVIND